MEDLAGLLNQVIENPLLTIAGQPSSAGNFGLRMGDESLPLDM